MPCAWCWRWASSVGQGSLVRSFEVGHQQFLLFLMWPRVPAQKVQKVEVFGYAALCTIIMLFVHGATKLPELLNWKTASDQLPACDGARRIAAKDRQADGAAKVLSAPN